MKIKALLILGLVFGLAAGTAGCGQSSGVGGMNISPQQSPSENSAGVAEKSISVSGDTYPLTVKDFSNHETVLEEKPQRVAVLSGTPLNIWYDLGGKSICTSDVSENLKLIPQYKEEILNLPSIGPVYSIDMEAVIAQQPDLIIAQIGTQTAQANKFREMGYKVITTQVRSYNDVIATYKAFGKILGAEKQAEQKTKQLDQEKEAIVKQLPATSKSVVILYVTAKSMAVKLDNSIAGDVAKMLNLKNIASDLPPDTIGSETTPLDIEYIVEKNPDYVLVTSMIDNNQEAQAAIEKELNTNPAWKGVKAVAEGRIAYLPQEYFLYNAGPYFDEAIDYMAKSVYPEIYGEVTGN